ncbi:CASP 1C1 [Olea europaea subsp. europaea]|uniref:CASP-like protein n=1 Tax=Olea europaea subsp. europaea TaxID=158383 RepID=A0A8S0T7D5_OLEEU|nr:CASP 1C1 [Olea europaea subsp. europaea]
MSLAKRIPIILLRLLALGAAVTATVIMVTSKDSAQVFNMKFEAKYTDSPTFKYFALINAIASGYTLIMLFFPSKNSCGHLILVFDLIMALLLDSSISACLAIGRAGPEERPKRPLPQAQHIRGPKKKKNLEPYFFYFFFNIKI